MPREAGKSLSQIMGFGAVQGPGSTRVGAMTGFEERSLYWRPGEAVSALFERLWPYGN
ncbi:hypothetical protein [Streptomyces kaniharaensis]|uniref:hypothetical protein n=1 Tax=Streptomyces kaniharaensis TaxID=212423 RepID=UPI001297BA6C|nr:hypothetical protein [Streptomyces kaniharaensis]